MSLTQTVNIAKLCLSNIPIGTVLFYLYDTEVTAVINITALPLVLLLPHPSEDMHHHAASSHPWLYAMCLLSFLGKYELNHSFRLHGRCKYKCIIIISYTEVQ